MMRLSSLAVLAGVAGLTAALPGAAPAAAAGSDLVAVVIDFGTGGQAPIVQCVHDAGESDMQALADALAQAHAQAMRLDNGLICAFDGYPTSGCGEPTSSGGYAYWAYFHGSASGWAFASQGPAYHPASSLSTVGFRFEPDGTGSASDPKPTPPSNPVTDCPGIAAVPAGVPTPTTPPAVSTPIGAGATPTTTPGASSLPSTTTTTRLGASRRASISSAAKSASRGGHGSSSALPAVLAIGAFGALGTAAGVVWFKRRREA